MEIEVKCSKCGKEPEKDKKSNNNWKIYNLNKPCKFCGGKLIIITK